SLQKWQEGLRALDQYIQGAFVLSPGDGAVAFSAVKTEPGQALQVRSSFPGGSKKPWAQVLPAGLAYLDESKTLEPEALKRAYGPAIKELGEKKIWKEIREFLESPERVQTLVREAFPQSPES